jgi:hypothetical protein
MERRIYDTRTGEFVADPLRERFPVYVKVFLIGMVAIGALAFVVTLVSDTRPGAAFGFTAIFSGTLLLLVGGARGGGYSNLSVGAVEALVGGRNRVGDDHEADSELRHGNVLRRRDPMARLRKGLRPPPNPTAFWQTIAGFAYIAVGVPFTL